MQWPVRSAVRSVSAAVVSFVVLLLAALPAWAAVTANDDAAVAAEDTAVDIPVLSNDATDGSPLAITGVSTPPNGTASIIGSIIRYQPDPNYSGSDSFTYDIEADGFTDTATVFVTVNPANDPPTAASDSATTPEDTSVAIAVLANDSDPDGDPISLQSVGNASHGAVSLAGGDVSYVPDPDFSGSDLFTYTISDGAGGIATGVVGVTVTAVNDPPAAVDDSAGTFRDTEVTIAVTANDTDPDGDPVTVAAAGSPANGTASIAGSASIEYVPNPGFVGTDTFSYDITDPSGARDTATVAVTVSATNRQPAAVDDFAATGPDTPVVIDVLVNDGDPDGDELSLLTVGSPARGTATPNADGTVTYTPDAGFAGLDAFAYTAGDGNGGTDSGVVTISVAPASGAPAVAPDTAAVLEDESVGIDVLANDDPEVAVQSVGNAAHGSVALEADGTIRYSPVADYNGPDTFAYVATNLAGVSSSALVTVTVIPVNDAPVAQNDDIRSDGGRPLELDLLANDLDVDGDRLTAHLLTFPSGGTATLTADGIVRYEPDPGFVGIDSFRYEACDAELCAPAIVTVESTAPAQLPPTIDPEIAPDLPQQGTGPGAPPLTARPVISPSIGLNLAASASIETLRALLLPLTMLAVVMVWVLSANNTPFFAFWRRRNKRDEPPPIA